MNTTKRQFALILILNLLLGIALVVGVHQTVEFVNTVSKLTINSANEFYTVFEEYLVTFLKLDIKIIFGVFGAIGVLFYDVLLIIGYASSFRFTKKKVCNSCSKRLIREQRLTGDRIVSYVIPVKRFRCVGCGQQYLKLDKPHHHSHEHESITVPESIQTEKIATPL